MKLLAISKTFFRFETDEEDEASGKLDERLNKAIDEVKSVLERHGFEYVPGYTTILTPADYNLSQCVSCGCFMIDRSKFPVKFHRLQRDEDLESAIRKGAVSEGKALCEKCLPPEHELATR